MPGTSCCVENCHSRSCDPQGNKTGIRFFRFPHWKRSYGEQVAEVTKRRRMAWVAAVRRKDITFDRISQWMRVCSRHFHSGKLNYKNMSLALRWRNVNVTSSGECLKLCSRQHAGSFQFVCEVWSPNFAPKYTTFTFALYVWSLNLVKCTKRWVA